MEKTGLHLVIHVLEGKMSKKKISNVFWKNNITYILILCF